MIASFHLKVRLAIDILSRGADHSLETSNLRMAAIALSGFSFDKSAIWRQQCTTAQTQINDPHLRTMFAFLIPDSPTYDKVLVTLAQFNVMLLHNDILLKVFVIVPLHSTKATLR